MNLPHFTFFKLTLICSLNACILCHQMRSQHLSHDRWSDSVRPSKFNYLLYLSRVLGANHPVEVTGSLDSETEERGDSVWKHRGPTDRQDSEADVDLRQRAQTNTHSLPSSQTRITSEESPISLAKRDICCSLGLFCVECQRKRSIGGPQRTN